MDKDTFWNYVNPLQERLFKFAFSILKNVEDAQDAVHDVLVKLWYKRKSLKKDGNIGAFALKVMKNHCLDVLRKRKQLIQLDNDQILKHDGFDYEKMDTVDLIKTRIGHLPIQQRMIIELKDFQGYSYKEISIILEIPITTLRVNLSRARKFVLKSITYE